MPPAPLGWAVPLALQVFSPSVYTFKISRNAPGHAAHCLKKYNKLGHSVMPESHESHANNFKNKFKKQWKNINLTES